MSRLQCACVCVCLFCMCVCRICSLHDCSTELDYIQLGRLLPLSRQWHFRCSPQGDFFPRAAPVTFLTCVSSTIGQRGTWSLRKQPGLTDMTVNTFFILDLLSPYALCELGSGCLWGRVWACWWNGMNPLALFSHGCVSCIYVFLSSVDKLLILDKRSKTGFEIQHEMVFANHFTSITWHISVRNKIFNKKKKRKNEWMYICMYLDLTDISNVDSHF